LNETAGLEVKDLERGGSDLFQNWGNSVFIVGNLA